MTQDWFLLLARLLVASVFVVSAIDKFRLVPEEVAAIRALGLPAPAVLERLTGVCEVIAVLMLLLGPGTQIVAVLLAIFTLGVTFAFLRFWSFEGPPEAYMLQRNTFFSNLAMIGALIYIAYFGPGAFVLTQWG